MAEGSASNKPQRIPKDVALVGGPTEDGEGAHMLRLKDGELSAGELRPVREGQDLAGRELLRLKAMEQNPALHEVEVLYGPKAPDRAGPARVSSASYRKNFDQVFGVRRRPGRKKADYSVN